MYVYVKKILIITLYFFCISEENYQSEESSVPAQDSSQEGGEYSVMQAGGESDESL